jgi:hypothetical protein
VAQQMVAEQRYQDAAQTLAPLAYNPHPGEETDKARKLLQEVEAKLATSQAPSPDSTKAEAK